MSDTLQRLGEHFIVGLSGPVLTDEERRLLKALRPAGVILFGKNLLQTAQWMQTLSALLSESREAIGRERLFVSIDHEGGKVHRFPEPVTRFPAAAFLREKAEAVARAHAAELLALGFNLSFAPVMDVHSEPSNPVIGKRAFGQSPEEVSRYGLAYLHALEASGVLGCPKHFPGHGATVSDSHLVLPRLEVSRELIESRELIPFIAAITAGASLMMTAHVVYPALDADSPATLSRPIISDLLRGKLGYEGALITDDLEMKALAALPAEERAVRAMLAGVDLLLEANPKQECAARIATQMARGMADALDSERLSESLLGASQGRIRKTFDRLKTIERPAAANAIGAQAHLALKESIVEV